MDYRPRRYKGIIFDTGEPCVMEVTGFWTSSHGRITSYRRVDQEDNKQYSKDRNNVFYVETVD